MDNPFLPKTRQLRLPLQGEKIVFLDFDGVLHPRPEEAIPTNWDLILAFKNKRYFLEQPMSQLFRLCDTLNAKIVITSSWRSSGFDLSQFKDLFRDLIIGQTPDVRVSLNTRAIRELEIKQYLSSYDIELPYLAIDDKSENFTPVFPRLYLTDHTIGLTRALADQIIEDFGR